MALGAAFLTGMMSLVVANIIFRLCGSVIPGSYEISELMVVVVAAFALGYAALYKSHVVVKIVVSRFPQRTQAILEALMSLISLGTWAVITWASVNILAEKWLIERTELLWVPFLPFRFVFVFGLGLFSLVYLMDLFKALRQAVRK
jgi:TRAP-type C4-dicarboxylate transport system permease small subunit